MNALEIKKKLLTSKSKSRYAYIFHKTYLLRIVFLRRFVEISLKNRFLLPETAPYHAFFSKKKSKSVRHIFV